MTEWLQPKGIIVSFVWAHVCFVCGIFVFNSCVRVPIQYLFQSFINVIVMLWIIFYAVWLVLIFSFTSCTYIILFLFLLMVCRSIEKVCASRDLSFFIMHWNASHFKFYCMPMVVVRWQLFVDFAFVSWHCSLFFAEYFVYMPQLTNQPSNILYKLYIF